MMDGAYFTSRKDILDFLNSTFDLNLSKIEQTASGAVACQLTEYLFPNSIPMVSEVRFFGTWTTLGVCEELNSFK